MLFSYISSPYHSGRLQLIICENGLFGLCKYNMVFGWKISVSICPLMCRVRMPSFCSDDKVTHRALKGLLNAGLPPTYTGPALTHPPGFFPAHSCCFMILFQFEHQPDVNCRRLSSGRDDDVFMWGRQACSVLPAQDQRHGLGRSIRVRGERSTRIEKVPCK